MKKIIFITLYIGILAAQIQHEGLPKFFNTELDRINSIQINTDYIVERDFDPMVFQFGDEYDVDINIINDSEVIVNNDGSYTFILSINSERAYGLGFNFSDFFLTNNASLFFYDREKTSYLGALTHLNNKDTSTLTTSIIKGDNVIIELTVPIEEIDDVRLVIDSVIHDYTDIMNYYDTSNSNREDCNINVICPEGDDWRDQINGVFGCKIIIM